MPNHRVMLTLLLLLATAAAAAQDGAIESLRQTGKAFASVARTVSSARYPPIRSSGKA